MGKGGCSGGIGGAWGPVAGPGHGTSSGTDVLAMRNSNDGEKVWGRREKVRVYRGTRKHNGNTK